MNVRNLFVVSMLTLLGWSSASAATILEIAEDVYEVSAADVRLPVERGRTMYLKTCQDCPPTALQVDQKTMFFDGDSTVEYAEFRDLLKKHYSSAVYVFYRPGTDEVMRIKLSVDIKPSASPVTPPAKPGQDDQRRRPGFRTGS
jgi:hypothetical protein